MKSVPLFGSNETSTNKNHLMEFRAGKMAMEGNWVCPDKRSGVVFITRTDDGLLQFCWKCRSTGIVEDSFVVFPNDARFYHISKCKSGRVYLLYFSEAKTKHFYWLQEPKTNKDQYYCERVNSFLNQTSKSSGVAERSGNGSTGSLNDMQYTIPTGMDSILGSLSNNDLVQLLTSMQSGVSPNLSEATISNILPTQQEVATQNTKSEAGKNTKWIELSDLQNVLNTIPSPLSRSEGNKPEVDLTKVLVFDDFINMLESNTTLQDRILQHLTQEDVAKSEECVEERMKIIRANLKDPNFLQTVRIISGAFHTGGIISVLEQFNFPQTVRDAASSGNFICCAEEMEKAFVSSIGNVDEAQSDDKMEVDNTDDAQQHAAGELDPTIGTEGSVFNEIVEDLQVTTDQDSLKEEDGDPKMEKD